MSAADYPIWCVPCLRRVGAQLQRVAARCEEVDAETALDEAGLRRSCCRITVGFRSRCEQMMQAATGIHVRNTQFKGADPDVMLVVRLPRQQDRIEPSEISGSFSAPDAAAEALAQLHARAEREAREADERDVRLAFPSLQKAADGVRPAAGGGGAGRVEAASMDRADVALVSAILRGIEALM